MQTASRLFRQAHTLSCVDQVIVSGLSFCIIAILGRYTDAASVGLYALAISAVAVVLAMHDALVVRTLTVHAHDTFEQPSREIAGYFAASLLLSTLSAVGLAVASGLSAFSAEFHSAGPVLLASAIVIPAILAREFVRRCALAFHMPWRAVVFDGLVAIQTIALLCIFIWIQVISPESVLVAFGIACISSVLISALTFRNRIRVSLSYLSRICGRCWRFGKWFLLGSTSVHAQGFVILGLIFALIGPDAAGTYAACLTVVGLANPLLYGLFNSLLPRYVSLNAHSGLHALRRGVLTDTMLLGGALCTFVIFVWLAGGMVLKLMFGETQFASGDQILFLLAVETLVGWVGVPAALALSALRDSKGAAAAMAITALSAVSASALLLPRFGLFGAVIGLILAQLLGTSLRWFLFLRASSPLGSGRTNSVMEGTPA